MKDLKILVIDLKNNTTTENEKRSAIKHYLSVEHDKGRYDFVKAIEDGKINTIKNFCDLYIEEFGAVNMRDIVEGDVGTLFELNGETFSFLGISKANKKPNFKALGKREVIELEFSNEDNVRRIF
jgi:hypothetical protein